VVHGTGIESQQMLAVFYTPDTSRDDNLLLQTGPELNQPQFHFITAVHINTFLHGRLCLIVNCIKGYGLAVRNPQKAQILRNRVWRLSPHFHKRGVHVHGPAEI